MADFPRSLLEFQRRFPDDGRVRRVAGRGALAGRLRLPGLRQAQGVGAGDQGLDLRVRRLPAQTSVTAGTVMHGSKLPLTVWFWAAYLMATHSNGISALQLQEQLGLGSYKTAWLLCAKLRRAMVAPGRQPLAGLVEVDETEIPCRTKDDPLDRRRRAQPPGQDARSPARSRSRAAGPAACGWRDRGLCRQDPARLHPRQPSPPAPPSRPTAGPAIPALPASTTSPTSSARWPPTSSCPGSTASSPTSRPGRSASTTACAASTSKPTSTSSPSASIAAAPDHAAFRSLLAIALATQTRHLQHVDRTGSNGISLS